MTASIPSVGVVTTSTNSFSRGYLAYLACIDAWSKFADQIVIVDGGTTDESYDILRQWATRSNWEVYRAPETLWGSHGRWHAAQWTINTNAGLRRLETDWAFVICSDYVLDFRISKSIREELAANGDAYVVTYKRSRLAPDGQPYLTQLRGIAINLKKMRADGARVCYGVSREMSIPSDFPIYMREQTQFIDPVNGSLKTTFRGNWVPVGKDLDLNCVVYGYYFFNLEQVLAKLTEYDRVYQVRYSKRAPKSRAMFMTEYGFSREGYLLSKEAELRKSHPPEIRRVIEHFYQPDMLGHSSRPVTHQPTFPRQLFRLYQAIRTAFFQLRSFPSVREAHTWCPVGDSSVPPLNLKRLYEEQDRYLPREERINWNISQTMEAGRE